MYSDILKGLHGQELLDRLWSEFEKSPLSKPSDKYAFEAGIIALHSYITASNLDES